MPNAEREAYITTLEEENARMKKSLEFALARKQTFADELFEVTHKLKQYEEFVRKVKESVCCVGDGYKTAFGSFMFEPKS